MRYRKDRADEGDVLEPQTKSLAALLEFALVYRAHPPPRPCLGQPPHSLLSSRTTTSLKKHTVSSLRTCSVVGGGRERT
jgi:hypothetical protein